MPITRWELFREPVSLQTRVNYLFRDLNDAGAPVTAASFAPAVDVYEDTKKVVLKLEIPGVDQKDLDIRVENRTLTVKGERKFEAEEPGGPKQEKNFLRIERRHGTFFRPSPCPRPLTRRPCRPTTTTACLSWSWPKRPKPSPSRSKSMWPEKPPRPQRSKSRSQPKYGKKQWSEIRDQFSAAGRKPLSPGRIRMDTENGPKEAERPLISDN